MEPLNLIKRAQDTLLPIFSEIDDQVKQNLRKVLQAYRDNRVGVHHFSSMTGYGYNDIGRETLDQVFAQVLGAESALVRVQMVSGTQAIACALYGILRPGDELLSITGKPYDTLEEVIGIRGEGNGSLKDFGISYRQVNMLPDGTLDWEKIGTAVDVKKTRLVLIQRSCGYSWRSSLSIDEISRIIKLIKQQNPKTLCFVDNCYGEFIETLEPTAVGADLIAGSLIKNLGGTIVTAGGYIAGKSGYVEAAACRLTSPGIGSHLGATFDQNRLLFQGLFLAPQMVGEAIKSSHLISYVFDHLGYPVNPPPLVRRRDVIQAITLGSKEKLIALCRSIQKHSPIGAYLDPIPSAMPGYDDELVMAGGTFIDGSTSELSADGPLREPYILFCQGGTHWTHTAIALEAALEEMKALL